MTFVRQYKINGQWVNGNDVEHRDVDACAGCGEIIDDGQLTVHLRLLTFRKELVDWPQQEIHEGGECFDALIKRYKDILEGKS